MATMKPHSFFLIWLRLLVLSAGAQYTETAAATVTAPFPDSTNPASACSSGNIHHVSVGGVGFSFDPAVTYANPGDVVVFTFWPSNHSVVRTDYTGSQSSGNPCVPIEVLQPGATGFFSGNKIIEADPTSGNAVTWNLTIKDRTPIWFYCDAPGSCHPNGMIGVVNPNVSGSFQRQQAAAKAAPFQLSPTGTTSPSEGGTGLTQKSSGSGTLSPGAIAGISIGGFIVLALAASLCYFVGRTSSYKSMLRKGEKPDPQNALPPDATSVSSPQTDTSTIASPYHSPQPSTTIQGFGHPGQHPLYPAYPGYFVPSNKDLSPVPYGGFSPGARFETNTSSNAIYEHDGVEIPSVAGSPTSGATAQSPIPCEESHTQPAVDEPPMSAPGPVRWA